MIEDVVNILQSILATELTSYMKLLALSLDPDLRQLKEVSGALLEGAAIDRNHILAVAARIADAGSHPDMNPATLISRSVISYQHGVGIGGVARDLLSDQHIIIENYTNLKNYLELHDSTSSKLISEVIEQENYKIELINRIIH